MTSVIVGQRYEDAVTTGPGRRQAPTAGDGRPASELDELTVARLTGAARRHASGREPTEAETAEAVAELSEMAGGRGDLLAEVAGLLMGYYRGTAEAARAEVAAHCCVTAGADLDLIPAWIEVGRRRAATARQSSGIDPSGGPGHRAMST